MSTVTMMLAYNLSVQQFSQQDYIAYNQDRYMMLNDVTKDPSYMCKHMTSVLFHSVNQQTWMLLA